MCKAHQRRSTLGSWDVDKVHAVVARSTFRSQNVKNWRSRTTSGNRDVEKVHAAVARSTHASQNVQNTPGSEHFLKLRCRTSARRCGAKHTSKPKCLKHTSFEGLFEVEMSNECTPLWCEAHFQVKVCKTHQNTPGSEHFLKLRCRTSARRCGAKHASKSKVLKTDGLKPLLDVQMPRGRRKPRKELCTLSNISKTCWFIWFCSSFKNDGRRGTFDLERCISPGRRSARDMFIRDARRSGRWFPERGCILEHQIFRFAETILRDRCNTSYDLASLLHGRRSTLHTLSGKSQNALARGSQLCTQLPIFEGSLAELLRFWCSQRDLLSFFDVTNFENSGSLADLLRFWCCPIQKQLADRQIER